MIPVLPYRQRPSYCGPASLLMVARFYGVASTELEIGKLAKTTVAAGTSIRGLQRAAAQLGLRFTWKDDATLRDLERYVKKGIPTIVDWFSTDEGHYSVVVDIDKKHVYLQDPELGKIRKMQRGVFLRVWFDFRPDHLRSKNDLILRRLIIVKRKR